MPYFIAGDVADYHSLIVRTPEQMAKRGVEVHVRHEVTAIDPDARTVTGCDLERGREFTHRYDGLVIATGARPAQPPLPGSGLEGIFVLRSLDEGRALRRFLDEHKPQRALVLGGGYVGVEMAETFGRLGLQVQMVIRSGKVMRTTLDDDVRALVEEELTRQGVEVVQGKPAGFEGRRRVEAVVTEDNRYPCDVALLSVGGFTWSPAHRPTSRWGARPTNRGAWPGRTRPGARRPLAGWWARWSCGSLIWWWPVPGSRRPRPRLWDTPCARQ
jgi:NADPH-dependent 2,4-dienoyl-CoA reductase/sulfur reductase-like enzyme